MSLPIQVTGILTYLNGPLSANLDVAGLYVSIIGSRFNEGAMLVSTVTGGTALPIAGLNGVGWMILVNNDPTNYIYVLTGINGTIFLKIMPGEFFMGRLAGGYSVLNPPAVQANVNAVTMSYLILED